MCIVLYVKHIWCSSIPYICHQLEVVTLALVYVHCAIWYTYSVYWYSINVWAIGVGYMCQTYMCILLYVKLIWCSGISQIFGQLEEGESWYMCIFLSVKPFSVAVFLTSMINWMGYICPQCMCILLYVKLIWCSGISQIYVQLEEGESWYMCILLSVKPLEVAVFHTSMINQMGDPSLLSIHAFCQITPNMFNIQQNACILRTDGSTLQLTLDLWNTTMLNMFNIQHNAHILKTNVPHSN